MKAISAPSAKTIIMKGEDFHINDFVIILGDLNLEDVTIKSLPEDMLIVGNLNLTYCRIELSSGIRSLWVNGNCNINCSIFYGDQLPDSVVVEGNLSLHGFVTNLPDKFAVGGSLDISGTEIRCLPDGLGINGDLIIRNTEISEIPNNLTVDGNLDIRCTNICFLPDDLSVKGLIDARGSNVYCTDCISSKIDPKKVITDQ